MNPSVVVFGGAGFVGTRLCELLRDAGRSFLIVDKRMSETFPAQTVLADVRDPAALARVAPFAPVWVNLAAEHRDDVSPISLYQEVNVEGARNLSRAAAGKAVPRIVFTSSVACYGNAPPGTDETGEIAPTNEYGRTKFEAEEVFRSWQREAPATRSLAVVRPTVVFGERNRGNVYNLLRQIALRRFVMVGPGRNVKSMAYVGNLASFLRELLDERHGDVLANYVDRPAIDMNSLVGIVRKELGRSPESRLRLPIPVGLSIGMLADVFARVTRRKLPVSAVRVRKFTTDSCFTTRVSLSGFDAPYPMDEALRRTIRFEFLDGRTAGPVFYTE